MLTLEPLVLSGSRWVSTYISAEERIGAKSSSFAIVIGMENDKDVFGRDLEIAQVSSHSAEKGGES
jgi:hypothetical protein